MRGVQIVADEDQQRPVDQIERIGPQPDPPRRRVAQDAAGEAEGAAVGIEDQDGAGAGRERIFAGKGRVAVQQQVAGRDQHQPRQRKGAAGGGAARRRRRAGGQQRAQEQLPGPEGRQVEVPQGIDPRRDDRGREGHQRQGRQPGHVAPAGQPRDRQHHEREGQIELLFHRQRPGVQQGRGLGGGGGVVAQRLGDPDVGQESDHRDRDRDQLVEVGGKQDDRPGQQHQRQHGVEGGKDPPDAALVEACQRKAPASDLLGDLAADQEAGDHEEDVDAAEAAAEARGAEVIEHHRHDGDGAQPVYVPSITDR